MRKKYILNGFVNRDEAQKRNHIFAIKNGHEENSGIKYMFNPHCLIKEEWGLEISEEYLHLLDESEKTSERLKEIPFQPFVQSYIPMVFRYLENKYIDQFFEDGTIRLSSFKKFHQHIDEQRGDKSEGNNMVVGNGGEKQFTAMTYSGSDAFVLSTSLMLNEQMYIDFKVDGCFVIEKPFEFMDAIAKKLESFKGVNFGPCLYKPDRIIQRNMPGFDLDSFKSDDDPNNMDMGKMFNSIQEAGRNDTLFAKTNEYSPQHEYRFLWHTEMEPLPDFIDIKVPEAIEFCRKLNRK